MKITKRQLLRIIKEEKSRLMSENKPGVGNAKVLRPPKAGEPIWTALASLIDQAMDQARNEADFLELANDLRGYAEDVEGSIPEDEEEGLTDFLSSGASDFLDEV